GDRLARRRPLPERAMLARRTPLLLVLLAPAALATDLGFDPLVLTYAPGTNPRLVLVQDVTGDGLPDIVVASVSKGQIVVRNGEGGFEFGAAVTTTLSAPVETWRAGDMNGDGATDLVLHLKDDSRVRVLLADGLGGFAPTGALDLTPLPSFRNLDLLDADEDGKL